MLPKLHFHNKDPRCAQTAPYQKVNAQYLQTIICPQRDVGFCFRCKFFYDRAGSKTADVLKRFSPCNKRVCATKGLLYKGWILNLESGFIAFLFLSFGFKKADWDWETIAFGRLSFFLCR